MDQQKVKDLFDYRDGKLFWKVANIGSCQTYKEAGTINSSGGYRRIMVDKKHHLTHRLVYLMHHGHLPKFLDHINNNRLDNRIENLREVTRTQNNLNQNLRKDNSSGHSGIYFSKQFNSLDILRQYPQTMFSNFFNKVVKLAR